MEFRIYFKFHPGWNLWPPYTRTRGLSGIGFMNIEFPFATLVIWWDRG